MSTAEDAHEVGHAAPEVAASAEIDACAVSAYASSACAPSASANASWLQATAPRALAAPLQHVAPSRWAGAAASASTGVVTSLPGGAFRESATLRTSFWLCRGCDLA